MHLLEVSYEHPVNLPGIKHIWPLGGVCLHTWGAAEKNAELIKSDHLKDHCVCFPGRSNYFRLGCGGGQCICLCVLMKNNSFAILVLKVFLNEIFDFFGHCYVFNELSALDKSNCGYLREESILLFLVLFSYCCYKLPYDSQGRTIMTLLYRARLVSNLRNIFHPNLLCNVKVMNYIWLCLRWSTFGLEVLCNSPER